MVLETVDAPVRTQNRSQIVLPQRRPERTFVVSPPGLHSGFDIRATIKTVEEMHDVLFATSGVKKFAASRNPEDLSPEVRIEADRLRGKAAAFHTEVTSPESQRILNGIAEKIKAADAKDPHASFAEKVAARRKEFPGGVLMIFDVDKTVTDPVEDHFVDVPGVGKVDPYVLGGPWGESVLGPDRKYFPEAVAGVWQKMVKYYPEIFFYGGTNARIREGMQDLFTNLIHNNIDISIVSANFLPFLEGVFSNIEGHEAVDIYGITKDSMNSASKGDMVRYLALKNPRKAIMFAGDGSSDEPVIEARDYITAPFALEGDTFDRRLSENGVEHFTFRTGRDIQQQILRQPLQ